jgi:hypothetical protein
MAYEERDRRVSSYSTVRPGTAKSEVTFDDILQGWNPPNVEQAKDKKGWGKKGSESEAKRS